MGIIRKKESYNFRSYGKFCRNCFKYSGKCIASIHENFLPSLAIILFACENMAFYVKNNNPLYQHNPLYQQSRVQGNLACVLACACENMAFQVKQDFSAFNLVFHNPLYQQSRRVASVCQFNWQMYICSQVTSSRDGFLVVVYCLLSKAFGKEGCDQLTAMNFKNILFFSVLFFCLYLFSFLVFTW